MDFLIYGVVYVWSFLFLELYSCGVVELCICGVVELWICGVM